MPVSREEFESGRINRRADIFRILAGNRERAFSIEELLRVVNFEGVDQSAAGPFEFARSMTTRPPTSSVQVVALLEEMVNVGAVVSREIEDITYFIVG